MHALLTEEAQQPKRPKKQRVKGKGPSASGTPKPIQKKPTAEPPLIIPAQKPTRTPQQLREEFIAPLFSSKACFSEHFRVTKRWKTKDLDTIRTFTDKDR